MEQTILGFRFLFCFEFFLVFFFLHVCRTIFNFNKKRRNTIHRTEEMGILRPTILYLLCTWPWWGHHDEGDHDEGDHDEGPMMRAPWWGHHDEDTMMRAPWWGHHDEDTMMRTPWWGHHDEGTMMRAPWWGHHDEGTTMRAPWWGHAASNQLGEATNTTLKHPVNTCNAIIIQVESTIHNTSPSFLHSFLPSWHTCSCTFNHALWTHCERTVNVLRCTLTNDPLVKDV